MSDDHPITRRHAAGAAGAAYVLGPSLVAATGPGTALAATRCATPHPGADGGALLGQYTAAALRYARQLLRWEKPGGGALRAHDQRRSLRPRLPPAGRRGHRHLTRQRPRPVLRRVLAAVRRRHERRRHERRQLAAGVSDHRPRFRPAPPAADGPGRLPHDLPGLVQRPRQPHPRPGAQALPRWSDDRRIHHPQIFFSDADNDRVLSGAAPYNTRSPHDDPSTDENDTVLSSAARATNIVSVTGSISRGFAATFAIVLDDAEVDARGSLARPTAGGSPPA